MNLTYDDNTLRLNGEQNFDNADSLNNKGLAILQKQSGDVVVDAQELTNFNSAMLAILMQWQHEVSKNNGTLKVIHAPNQLHGLIKLTQLEEYLILDSSN